MNQFELYEIYEITDEHITLDTDICCNCGAESCHEEIQIRHEFITPEDKKQMIERLQSEIDVRKQMIDRLNNKSGVQRLVDSIMENVT